MKEKLVCKVEKMESGYKYKCPEEKEGVCVVSTKGKSGGINIAGSGIDSGRSDPTIFCVDKKDLKKKLSEKYGKEIIIR